jgi:rhodanese-related sulfurtransferase
MKMRVTFESFEQHEKSMVDFHRTWARIITSLLLIVACHSPALSEQRLTDAEKLQTIYRMYDDYSKSFREVQDVSPQTAMKLAKSSNVVFVDIREAEEQKVSMIPGAITEEEFRKDPDKYRKHIVIGYCTISYRSGKLAQKLREQGIVMSNLRGGLLAWVHEGGKVTDSRGETKRIHVYGKKWNYAPESYEAVW